MDGAQDDDSQVRLISYYGSASGRWTLQSLEVSNQMRWWLFQTLGICMTVSSVGWEYNGQ